MTFPIIQATATTGLGTPFATSTAVAYPASIQPGDLLVAMFQVGANSLSGLAWPAGWVELDKALVGGSYDGQTTAYRWCDGSESGTFTVTHYNWNKRACRVLRISGADSARNPTATAFNTGGGTSHDPPNHNTGLGAAEDILWLAFSGVSAERTLSSYPTNYTLGQGMASSGTADGTADNCRVASAGRQLSATAENPGAFVWSAASGHQGRAVTVAVYPAPPPAAGGRRRSQVMVIS